MTKINPKNSYRQTALSEEAETYDQVVNKLSQAHERDLKNKLNAKCQRIEELEMRISELE